jgi:hypothetical protein
MEVGKELSSTVRWVLDAPSLLGRGAGAYNFRVTTLVSLTLPATSV